MDMEVIDNRGFKITSSVDDEGTHHKVKIPVSSIYRFKQAFYKHLDVDEVTMATIRLYNYVKQVKTDDY